MKIRMMIGTILVVAILIGIYLIAAYRSDWWPFQNKDENSDARKERQNQDPLTKDIADVANDKEDDFNRTRRNAVIPFPTIFGAFMEFLKKALTKADIVKQLFCQATNAFQSIVDWKQYVTRDNWPEGGYYDSLTQAIAVTTATTFLAIDDIKNFSTKFLSAADIIKTLLENLFQGINKNYLNQFINSFGTLGFAIKDIVKAASKGPTGDEANVTGQGGWVFLAVTLRTINLMIYVLHADRVEQAGVVMDKDNILKQYNSGDLKDIAMGKFDKEKAKSTTGFALEDILREICN